MKSGGWSTKRRRGDNVMTAPAFATELLEILEEHWLLERLCLASLELAVLAGCVWLVIQLLRLRQPRVIALLWLIVLIKPLVSFGLGGFLPAIAIRPRPKPVMIVSDVVDIPQAPALDVRMPAPPVAPEKKWRWPGIAECLIWMWGCGVGLLLAKGVRER